MGVKSIRAFFWPLCFVFATSGHAEISGYAKLLWSNTETVIGERESVNLGIHRARITWRDNILRAQFLMSYDLEWRKGSYLDTLQYRLQQSLQAQPYWELQKKWHSGIDEEGYHSLYRAYLKVPLGSVDLRFGRQQLNWSRTFLWSSFDRFNPNSPLQLEPDERQGIDALQLIWNLANSRNLELAYLPGHSSAQRLDDGSRVWSPTLRYSPGRYEDLHFRLGLQYFEGSASSEFGRFNTLAFGEIQWFY